MPGEPSERFPCLVDLKQVRAADQIWATDITTSQLQKGFIYLVVSVDLFPRNVLSWKLSNSLETEFCLEALEMTLSSARKPEIFHSDQGCQFTPTDFVSWQQTKKSRSAGHVQSAAITSSFSKGYGHPPIRGGAHLILNAALQMSELQCPARDLDLSKQKDSVGMRGGRGNWLNYFMTEN